MLATVNRGVGPVRAAARACRRDRTGSGPRSWLPFGAGLSALSEAAPLAETRMAGRLRGLDWPGLQTFGKVGCP